MKIKKTAVLLLTAFLSVSYSNYAISVEKEFSSGEAIVSIKMLENGEAHGFATIDLHRGEFKFLATNKLITYPFNITEVKENKICFEFKNKNKSKSELQSCVVKTLGNSHTASGFLEPFNKHHKLIKLILITDNNIQSTLLSTKWTSGGVNDCENDFIKFSDDYRTYSRFITGNEEYSYQANIKFKNNGLIHENGKDINGDLVENEHRIFIDEKRKRLFIHFISSRDPNTLKWNVLGDGHWYKSCLYN